MTAYRIVLLRPQRGSAGPRLVLSLGLAHPAVLGTARAAEVVFPVVADGHAVVKIVVAGENKTLAAAVGDLKTYVQRMSGAEVEVTQGTEDLAGPTLHLGETVHFPATAAAREAIKLDGFVIARVGEDLIIAGSRPEGTANGIWTVLQDQFGVRWYYAGPLWEVVPENRSLAITVRPNTPAGAYLGNPSFYGRTLWGRPPTEAFGRHMRMTQKGVPLPYVGTGHSLNHVVNPGKYGDHPDYFAYYDGRRHVEHDVHPCFTHPDMFDVFMAYVREGGRSFGVNDNLSACKCERCLAVDGESEPYMGMWNFSESYFQLITRVAAQTAKEFPGVRLGVFAYQPTNSQPKTVDHIGDNVDVVLCQDTAQYFDPEYKRIDQTMSAQWAKMCGGVRFYDYIGINYWMPRYFPHILADQLHHIAHIGVKGYGTHSSTMADTSMPMFYLLYQMLWNADLDPDAVIDEMMTNLYAEAAGPIGRYYDHWEQCWDRQKKGRWFWGMDNFRGETEIYTREDIERGQALLDEAAALATSDVVRERVAFLQDRFGFTRTAAKAHFVSMDAMRSSPPADHEAAIASSLAVVDAWRAFETGLDLMCQIPGTTVSGWMAKTDRVRAWGLKQQMRDAVTAPLVRWITAHEGRVSPARLRFIERTFAGVALSGRADIERRVTNKTDASYRKPRADALQCADIPRLASPLELSASLAGWPGVPRVDAVEWVYRLRPTDAKAGKYDEPLVQHYVDAPKRDDQSMTWQAAWDDRRLYLRVVVRDDLHVQNQPAEAMWKEDSVQIALNAARDQFAYDASSWDYIWGGYRGPELEFGVSAHGDATDLYVWHVPEALGDADAKDLIQARAARDRSNTIYEAAVDWKLVPGFKPQPEHSVGICVVVNDLDEGIRRSAEYGSGVAHAKRPAEFAALRLVGARMRGKER